MKRVLITGMSGTGKSSVIEELVARGRHAYDLDTLEWSRWVDADPADTLTPSQGKDWVWRDDRVRALLSRPGDGMLFVSGCAENMGRFLPMIDVVILLTAPVATIMERLAMRSVGYGRVAEERRKIGHLILTIEPLLRKSADFEIDTAGPVPATVDEILNALADPTRREIFERLCRAGEQNVRALTDYSEVSQPAVSKHLGILKEAGLVRAQKHGRQTRYRARPQGLGPLVNWMALHAAFWRDRFDDLENLLNRMDQ